MRIAMTILAVSLALGPGCKKKESAPAAGSAMTGSSDMGSAAGSAMAGSAAGSDMGSAMAGSAAGSAMAGSDMGSAAMAGSGAGSDAAAMAGHAGNCPSTVYGSTTKAEVKGKDVVVSITSDDKDAIKAIQTRTDEMLKARLGKKEPGSEHDRRGTHGGKLGLCPVHIPEGATAKSKHEKNGVVVTITPKEKPEELKTEIDGRIQKSADWVKENVKAGDKLNQGGVGGGSAAEGMNRSGQGDGKGAERKKAGGTGDGGGKGTGGGGGKGTGGGSGKNK